jgi:hypothetical protein
MSKIDDLKDKLLEAGGKLQEASRDFQKWEMERKDKFTQMWIDPTIEQDEKMKLLNEGVLVRNEKYKKEILPLIDAVIKIKNEIASAKKDEQQETESKSGSSGQDGNSGEPGMAFMPTGENLNGKKGNVGEKGNKGFSKQKK